MKHVIVIVMGETDSGRRISIDRDAGGFRVETNDNRDGYIADGLIDLDLTLHDIYRMAESADQVYRTLSAEPVYAPVAISEPYTTPEPPTQTERGANRRAAGAPGWPRIVELLAAGEDVPTIAVATGLTESAIYKHLKALREESPAPPAPPFRGNGNGQHV